MWKYSPGISTSLFGDTFVLIRQYFIGCRHVLCSGPDCWCSLKKTVWSIKIGFFYLCWLNNEDSQLTSALGQNSGLFINWIKLPVSEGLKSQTCLAWKSPFLSQLGIGIVKRSSCVRVFDASLSNALCSSARHGACRKNHLWFDVYTAEFCTCIYSGRVVMEQQWKVIKYIYWKVVVVVVLCSVQVTVRLMLWEFREICIDGKD